MNLTSKYILCPMLKCRGFKDTEVCYRKCVYYRNGKCDTIKDIYKKYVKK